MHLARVLPSMRGRQILLLQGPNGPFFRRLALDLNANGNVVTKVNFNGGDWFYFRKGENYRGDLSELPDYLRYLILSCNIDLILMFSDCRPVHVIACNVAKEMQIETGVFEEGYIRPNHITFERSGVNANSKTNFLANISKSEIDLAQKYQTIERDFFNRGRHAFLYFLFGILGRFVFKKYKHHKALTPRQAIWWIRSAIRKILVQRKDRIFIRRLKRGEFPNLFLVALQVYDDFQVVTHSDYTDVRDFIKDAIDSFIRNAPPNAHLLVKHHPMDRGYRDYTHLIAELVQGTGFEDHIHYQHEIDLASVLDLAIGTVVINSTVGLESVARGCPTCVTGRSFYKLPELVYDGDLDNFWRNAGVYTPSEERVTRMLSNIYYRTQVNGSYYTPFSTANGKETTFAGLKFFEPGK